MQTPYSTRHSLADIRQQAIDIITQLTSIGTTSEQAIGHTVRLAMLIDALPFPADHYAVAKNRLQNAQRYFVCSEIGAARYELRLMLGQLAKSFL